MSKSYGKIEDSNKSGATKLEEASHNLLYFIN